MTGLRARNTTIFVHHVRFEASDLYFIALPKQSYRSFVIQNGCPCRATIKTKRRENDAWIFSSAMWARHSLAIVFRYHRCIIRFYINYYGNLAEGSDTHLEPCV